MMARSIMDTAKTENALSFYCTAEPGHANLIFNKMKLSTEVRPDTISGSPAGLKMYKTILYYPNNGKQLQNKHRISRIDS